MIRDGKIDAFISEVLYQSEIIISQVFKKLSQLTKTKMEINRLNGPGGGSYRLVLI